MKYRKKPIIIEAIQWNGENENEIRNFIDGNCIVTFNPLMLYTLEGNMIASKNDYIVKGADGEFYPCKPDIFKKTYERV